MLTNVPHCWTELHSISGGFLSFHSIFFLFGTDTADNRVRLARSSTPICPQDPRSKVTKPAPVTSSLCFCGQTPKLKLKLAWTYNMQSSLGSILGYKTHMPEPRGTGNWQGPGSINSTRNSDTLWAVTYMRVPHLLESKAIVTNLPAFCLCRLADHMVWGGSISFQASQSYCGHRTGWQQQLVPSRQNHVQAD